MTYLGVVLKEPHPLRIIHRLCAGFDRHLPSRGIILEKS